MPTVLDDLKEQLHLSTIKFGADSFVSTQLRRQIAEAEKAPADGDQHFHGAMIKSSKPAK